MNTSNQQNIVARFAPSPTGLFHVGSLRTALFNYLYAKNQDGKYILRIEDTDKERSKKEYEEDILESLAWLGLNHEAFYRQSEHVGDHTEMLKRLVAEGKAYVSNEAEHAQTVMSEKAATENRRDSVIRFKNPNKLVTFTDLILGDIEVDTTDLGDFVIAKDFDTPLYNFAVVIDDMNMQITHVIRGQDHVSNTPRQILLYEALGVETPKFAHIPLILATDKAKLSKRKHGENVAVSTYRRNGYLPEALLNFMALVGWNPGTEQEIFSLEELVQNFSLDRVQKSAGVFNIDKLNWVNKEHIKKLPVDELKKYILEYLPDEIKNLSGYNDIMLEKIIPIMTERILTFGDIRTMTQAGEYTYYFSRPEFDINKLAWKKELTPEVKDQIKKHLQYVIEQLKTISDNECTQEKVKELIWPYAEENGKGDVLWPMRFSLSGMEKSPDPFILAQILGKQETIERLQLAIEKLD